MVASDTVVGIVGALLLVGVMAGVFVYEYRNAPTEGGHGNDGGDGHIVQFSKLDPTQDIDRDGKANGADPDVDGDGIANGNDTVVAVAVPVAGASPAVPSTPGGLPLPGAPSGVIYTSDPFFIGKGASHINGTIRYQSSVPSPAPAAPGLEFDIVDAQGSATPASCVTTGASIACSFDLGAQGLAVGNYTVQARETAPGPQTTFSGSLTVLYDAGMAE